MAPPDGGLAVGIAMDRATITKNADATLLRAVGGTGLALMAGLLMAALLGRAMIGRPVQRLSVTTEALLHGGTPARLGPPYASTAELGAVEQAMDALSDRLSRHEAALINSETQLSVKRQSEERFRALVELAPEAIVVEARGTVLYANSRAVDLFGADSMEELLAVPLIDRFHPDDREDCLRRLRDAGTEGAVSVSEARMQRFDGGDLVVELVVGPISYGGRPATHVMIRDVTESRLARRRLRETEERFRALVESSPDMILVHDLGRIILANSRAREDPVRRKQWRHGRGGVRLQHPRQHRPPRCHLSHAGVQQEPASASDRGNGDETRRRRSHHLRGGHGADHL